MAERRGGHIIDAIVSLPDLPVPSGPAPGAPTPTPRPTIGDAEYRMAMDALATSVRMLRLLPVAELRSIVSKSEALGPILEPTAYMRGGGDNLRDQSELLAAVAALIAVAERIEARAGVRR